MVSAATLFYVNLLFKIVTLAATFVGETLEIRKQFSGVSQSSSKEAIQNRKEIDFSIIKNPII